jgi:hypothetical protein
MNVGNNMILEQWHTWQPLRKMIEGYYIKSYTNDNFCSLAIVLEQYNAQKETELRILFDGIEAYKVTNETYRLKLWQYLSDTHKNLNRKWPLFTVENSTYLKTLSEDSSGITDYLHFKHYCIMDSEWSFDIATPTEPMVELFVDGLLIETNAMSK